MKNLLFLVAIVTATTPLSLPARTGVIPHEASPFAFHGPASADPFAKWEDYTGVISDLGVHWVRSGGRQGLRWGSVQPGEKGPYNWSVYDSLVLALQAKDINLMFTVFPSAGLGQGTPGLGRRPGGQEMPGPGRRPGGEPMGRGRPPLFRSPQANREGLGAGKLQPKTQGTRSIKLPDNIEGYRKFVEAAVERYDGDGKQDLPGLRFPIRYWMVSNEPSFQRFWNDTPENYAILVQETCRAIFSADPQGKVIIAGTPGMLDDYLRSNQQSASQPGHLQLQSTRKSGEDGFFVRVFKRLGPSGLAKVHALDFHKYFSYGEAAQIEPFVEAINALSSAFATAPKPLWMTETGTFAGEVKPRLSGPGDRQGTSIKQTETEQACALVRLHVLSLARGVKKVFWFGPCYKGGDSFFGNIGILSRNLEPRLAYFSYKKMVEMLGPSDWSRVEEIKTEKDSVRLFRFPGVNRRTFPVYVALRKQQGREANEIKWRFNSSGPVRITEAVPRAKSGRQVSGYGSAFKTRTESPQNGGVIISIGESPVYIESVPPSRQAERSE